MLLNDLSGVNIFINCPNKKIMILCGAEIMANSEEEERIPPLDDTSDNDLEYLMEKEVLVIEHT